MTRALLAAIALLLCSAATERQAPISGWTPAQVARLKHWVEAAPEDALPQLDTGVLDAAAGAADQAATDGAATALALRLARMHLLGDATPAERAGWQIRDSDASVDLHSWLERSLSAGSVDAFFEGLRPQHSDYGALRAAYAAEQEPARRTTLARNMERWRWMPRSLGRDYVLVNSANFEASLWREGQRAASWRVVVGKPGTPTPIFSATITGVTFNPWWDVPDSIVRESVGALVRRNPVLARQRGYVLSGGQYRQKPGPGNALGQMKLVMPNPYKVYLHDTSSKKLFERDVRAFSHGCIRVGDAMGFAGALLEGARTRAQIDAIVASRRTVTIDLPSHLPVYVTYFTAGTQADGSVAILSDIYGRDGRIIAAADREQFCAA